MAARASADALPPRSPRWPYLLLVVAGLVTYAGGLSAPFVLDDQASIVENGTIRQWWRLDRVLVPVPESPVAGRPLVNLSYALTYAVGSTDVAGYRVGNLALHIACAALAFALIRLTLLMPRVRDAWRGDPTMAAAVSAAIWCVHPLNSEVVNYISQRTESMMAACLLTTLIAFARAWTSERPRRWQVLAVMACAAGMACKETMVVAPVVVALYGWAYLAESWRELWRRQGRLLAALASTWILLAAFTLAGPRAAVGGFASGVSVWTYLLNQTGIITHYLRLVVWPQGLVVFYGWPQMLTLTDVWPSALFVVALLALTVITLVRRPMTGAPGAWFFMLLAPTSSVIAIATEVGAERRMYLPLLAIVVLVVAGAMHHADALAGRLSQRHRRTIGLGVAAACIVLLAAASIARTREYRSSVTLARTVVERRPTAIAHHILGEQLLLAGQTSAALDEFRQAVAGGDSKAGYSLGLALVSSGQTGEGAAHLDAFVATSGKRLVPRWLEPSIVELATARVTLARVRLAEGRVADAETLAREVLAVAPNHSEANRLVGEALFTNGRYTDAIPYQQRYAAARPGDAAGWIRLGLSCVGAERLPDAIQAFRRAVTAAPGDATPHRLLGMALLDSNQVDEALREARQAASLGPGDPVNQELLTRTMSAAAPRPAP